MLMLSAADVAAHLDYPSLINALHQGFAGDFSAPPRQLYALAPDKTGNHDAFALLPAWNERYISVKAFTYLPDNATQGLPGLHSQLMLFARQTGEPKAFIDGVSVTCARTAAVSALAALHLARGNSQTLLLLGTGNLAMPLLRAHLSVRPLSRILLWGRNPQKTKQLQQDAINELLPLYPKLGIVVVDDLSAAQSDSDIIVSATGSAEPLLFGALIKPGTHVDLLGNHNVDKRECDSALVQKARVFVDDKNNVLNEAGELLLPIAEGCFKATDIQADLATLCREGHAIKTCAQATQLQPEPAAGSTTESAAKTAIPPARLSHNDITLFKSVGTALSDLLCAALVLERYQQALAKEPVAQSLLQQKLEQPTT